MRAIRSRRRSLSVSPAAILFLSLAMLGTLSDALLAQLPMSARAMGVGGAYGVRARGVEGLFFNPAVMGLPENPYWSVAVPQVTVGASTLGLTFADLADAINYDDISDARKQQLLGQIPELGTEVRLDVRAPLFIISNGRLAVGAAYGVTGEHSVGKDLVELILTGFEPGRTDYTVDRTRGYRAGYFDFMAGYGRTVGPISLGLTGHYYHGQSVAQTRLFEPRFNLDATEIEADYVGVVTSGGKGYGVDVGVAMEVNPSLIFSAAIENVVSSMEWDDALKVKTLTLTRADFDNQDQILRALSNRYKGSERPYLPGEESVPVQVVAQGLTDDADFPARVRLASGWAPRPDTWVLASYDHSLTDGRLVSRWDKQAALGVEHQLTGTQRNGIAFRGGLSSDFGSGFLISSGVSLGPVQLGLARIRDEALAGGTYTGWAFSFGLATSSNLRSRGRE